MTSQQLNQPTLCISWERFEQLIRELASTIKDSNIHINGIYGIPRGGLIIAVRLSHLLNIPLRPYNLPNTLIVDDICDSGKTLHFHSVRNSFKYFYASLFKRHNSSFNPNFVGKILDHDSWIEFPWESK
jgi:hypoxanthine phosphoribosyltransferase